MLFRFSLYGFLKNQRYFEPFLILAFLEKGLSFGQIGLLVGFREICINLMEVPTGAVADVVGRRRAMICSFVAYMGSFAVFGLSRPLWALFAAMFLFSVGEAFRTGTHKAIIFDWLAAEGRAGEKTRVYGYTRSWSKIGSAVNVVVAGAVVFVTRRYSVIFLFSILPCAANIVNFLTYPPALDGPKGGGRGVAEVLRVLWAALRRSWSSRPLRRLLVEGAAFGGAFKAVQDYLQPVLKGHAHAAALALPLLAGLADRQQTAVFVAVIYCVLHLGSSLASRRAEAFRVWAGGEAAAARRLWWVDLGVFAALTAAVVAGLSPLAIAAFVVLAIIQNLWRPILVARFAEQADKAQMATALSIESQVRSLFAAVLAPTLGWAVDWAARLPAARGEGDLRFLPVGLAGLVLAVLLLATGRRGGRPATPPG